ncbi:MAG: GDSL-type esterase/lipase family protein, partial [Planctomycetota bacterium]
MRPYLPLLAFVLTPLAALAQPAGKPADKPAPAPPTTPTPPAKTAIKATTPEKHNGTEKRHENFNKISKEGKAQLVFLGDSITEGWEGGGKETWAKHYASRQAANFGVSGDRTEHVLWRLDNANFDGLKPKLIVIMIGTNNTGHRK